MHGYAWNMGWGSDWMWMLGMVLIVAVTLLVRGRR